MTTRIVQITPEIGPGTGVGSVAHHLEQAWQRQGIEVSRFTMAEARGDWLPKPSGGLSGKLALIARVVWFSTVGTVLARRHLKRHPDLLSVCHNDALAGDVYVNHGLVQVAMSARGNYALRMARNPVHLFTTARDRRRYRSRDAHTMVVNLSAADERSLRSFHPDLVPETVVIGNGVDLERFAPATGAERDAVRDGLGLLEDDRYVVFVGHEFDRKGLPELMEAVASMSESTHLVVVGGSSAMIRAAAQSNAGRVLGSRAHFTGAQPDPRPWLRAADVFALPSSYEAYPLVVLEALSCAVPVVATRTGGIPDVVVDASNGVLVERDADSIREGLERMLQAPAGEIGRAARASVEPNAWGNVAQRYLDVLQRAKSLRLGREGSA